MKILFSAHMSTKSRKIIKVAEWIESSTWGQGDLKWDGFASKRDVDVCERTSIRVKCNNEIVSFKESMRTWYRVGHHRN